MGPSFAIFVNQHFEMTSLHFIVQPLPATDDQLNDRFVENVFLIQSLVFVCAVKYRCSLSLPPHTVRFTCFTCEVYLKLESTGSIIRCVVNLYETFLT